jgi:hypothetical protein
MLVLIRLNSLDQTIQLLYNYLVSSFSGLAFFSQEGLKRFGLVIHPLHTQSGIQGSIKTRARCRPTLQGVGVDRPFIAATHFLKRV